MQRLYHYGTPKQKNFKGLASLTAPKFDMLQISQLSVFASHQRRLSIFNRMAIAVARASQSCIEDQSAEPLC
jgi:hypothetical protein